MPASLLSYGLIVSGLPRAPAQHNAWVVFWLAAGVAWFGLGALLVMRLRRPAGRTPPWAVAGFCLGAALELVIAIGVPYLLWTPVVLFLLAPLGLAVLLVLPRRWRAGIG